jgi:hypothetical protein
MHAHNFIINNRCTRQNVERVAEDFPHFDTVTSAAFIVKSINTIDTTGFVISSEDEKIFRVLYLVCEKKAYDLNRLLPSINIVPKKKIIGL